MHLHIFQDDIMSIQDGKADKSDRLCELHNKLITWILCCFSVFVKCQTDMLIGLLKTFEFKVLSTDMEMSLNKSEI